MPCQIKRFHTEVKPIRPSHHRKHLAPRLFFLHQHTVPANQSRKMQSPTTTLILALSLSAITLSRAALVYEPASEFSSTQNPRGPWSYGYSLTLGGELLSFNAS